MESFEGFSRYLMSRNVRRRWGDMLFPNENKRNLNVSESPITLLVRTSRIFFGHEFIGKKARPSSVSVLEFCKSVAWCVGRSSIRSLSVFKNVELAISR